MSDPSAPKKIILESKAALAAAKAPGKTGLLEAAASTILVDDAMAAQAMPAIAVPHEEPLRVKIRIMNVPVVVMDPCACGAEHRTLDVRAVKRARQRGSTTEPMRCPCGRMLVGYTPMLELSGN